MPTGVTAYDGSAVAYAPLAYQYATDLNSTQNCNEGWYVCTGGAVTASATAGKLDLAAGTDFVGTTEYCYSAQSAQPGTLSALSTTVTTNGVAVNSLTSGQLAVTATASFTASGVLAVLRAGAIISCIAYTSIGTPTRFDGVSLVSGWTNITFASATDSVVQVNNDLTAYKWLLCEVNATGSYGANLGAAGTSATAVKPSPTASTVLHSSVLLQPVSGNTSALQMDALPTITNGKSKIMESRQLVTNRADRILYTDSGKGVATSITNTALTSIVNATGSIPANSLSVGDVLSFVGSCLVFNNVSSFKEYKVFCGTNAVVDFTETNNGSGSAATIGFHFVNWNITALVTAIGASGNVNCSGFVMASGNGVKTATPTPVTIATRGEIWSEAKPSTTIDTTAALTLDFQTRFVSGNASNTALLYEHTVKKFPVA